ncbi:MAG: tRNA epoxyqueuosine(34) reductase QueG [Chlorobi bacterium]|nr:tRNA epoxyqueuosine(34) reductase QueG [Chlorobiota bacterium]
MPIKQTEILPIIKEFRFDLIGFAKAETLNDEIENLKTWLRKGYSAGMEYMERNVEKRFDVRNILPSAKSVISLGVNYYTPFEHSPSAGEGKVSRYAWGNDYHFIMWDETEKLIARLKKIFPSLEAKAYVDTGPVMDKAWAVRAGLGWLGKNGNVINKNIGSWFFIATIITNLEIEASTPTADLCGSCSACIDACPTNAIVAEGIIDANRCISYLTIENKGEISSEFRGKFDNWIFGCDICQDVCPWNKKFSVASLIKEFEPIVAKEIKFAEIFDLTNSKFKDRFGKSPIARARAKGLKRNAEFLNHSK